MFIITKKDKASYLNLMQQSQPWIYGKEDVSDKEKAQQRYNVRKDIWITKDEHQLHYNLKSKDSEVSLQQKDKGFIVTENMIDVVCYFQDKLYFSLEDGQEIKEKDGKFFLGTKEIDEKLVKPMQKIHSFRAKKATYFYHTQEVIAYDAFIKVYTSKSHSDPSTVTPEQVLMEGFADSLEFSFKDSAPSFKTYNLNAQFYLKDKTS